jgi:hypothetical protein
VDLVVRWYLSQLLFQKGLLATQQLYWDLGKYITSQNFNKFLTSCLFEEREQSDLSLPDSFFKACLVRYLKNYYSPKRLLGSSYDLEEPNIEFQGKKGCGVIGDVIIDVSGAVSEDLHSEEKSEEGCALSPRPRQRLYSSMAEDDPHFFLNNSDLFRYIFYKFVCCFIVAKVAADYGIPVFQNFLTCLVVFITVSTLLNISFHTGIGIL